MGVNISSRERNRVVSRFLGTNAVNTSPLLLFSAVPGVRGVSAFAGVWARFPAARGTGTGRQAGSRCLIIDQDYIFKNGQA
ncbi:hypothetical protein P3T23_007434 [Paraburkholderia sp. GAS448]